MEAAWSQIVQPQKPGIERDTPELGRLLARLIIALTRCAVTLLFPAQLWLASSTNKIITLLLSVLR